MWSIGKDLHPPQTIEITLSLTISHNVAPKAVPDVTRDHNLPWMIVKRPWSALKQPVLAYFHKRIICDDRAIAAHLFVESNWIY